MPWFPIWDLSLDLLFLFFPKPIFLQAVWIAILALEIEHQTRPWGVFLSDLPAEPMESQTSVSKQAPREFRNWRAQGTLRQPFVNPFPTFSANPSFGQPFPNLFCQPLSNPLFRGPPGTRLETRVNVRGEKKTNKQKTNKHKQFRRIVPEMGGGQIVYVFPFFFPGQKKETHKQNSQEISGKGRESPGTVPE